MNMKTALVTGGSGGIGKAICIKLASSGFHVIINYFNNKAGAKNTLKKILSANGSAEVAFFDVTDKNTVSDFYSAWKKKNEGKYIEVLVNNAGKTADNMMIMMNDDEWESVINVNLNAFFYVTKPLLRDMLKNKYGRIINIASYSGLRGMPLQTNYSAAKAGLIGATKALAQEAGRYNVTVNAVAPGYIKTKMTENFDEDILKRYIPLNRFGLPEEVANAVDFLASEKASYINGEIITVNGGGV